VRCQLRATVVGIAMLFAAAGPATTFPEVQAYYDSLKDICRTGVTPPMTAAWGRAQQALDAARYGGGRDGENFAGIKSPADAWLECFQSPGDGKQ
jgi:hypothetical protein